MVLLIVFVMCLTTAAGVPWEGVGVCLGLLVLRAQWRYMWPGTRRPESRYYKWTWFKRVPEEK